MAHVGTWRESADLKVGITYDLSALTVGHAL
jgi:hypothetical protein